MLKGTLEEVQTQCHIYEKKVKGLALVTAMVDADSDDLGKGVAEHRKRCFRSRS